MYKKGIVIKEKHENILYIKGNSLNIIDKCTHILNLNQEII